MRAYIQRKEPEILNAFIFNQDNARRHTALQMREFLQKWNEELLEHPPYTPDMVPCGFWLFPMLKRYLQCRKFYTNA